MPGQRFDTVGVAPLIEGIEFGGLIADKAFDANWIIAIRSLGGVRGVTNSVVVRPRLMSENVHELITRAYQRSADLESSQVKVEVEGSKVTLSGRVKTWYEQDMAERAAMAAPGVTQVINEIQIG